jgi:hypothetical protein
MHGWDGPLHETPRDPWPSQDTCRMVMAMTLLERSLDAGLNSRTVQFGTMRSQQAFSLNYYQSTPLGVGKATLADGQKRKLYF